MFVRFRERSNDGREPLTGCRTFFACAGRCNGPDKAGQRAGPAFRYSSGCQLRPRCRSRIGMGDGDKLVPYRLLVGLIENRRVEGKVQQTHVADLGAIDGWLLPAFFGGLEPERANAIRGNLGQWFMDSVEARVAFWRELDVRLARLSNRLTAEDATKIRAAIHARIARPNQKILSKSKLGTRTKRLRAGSGRGNFGSGSLTASRSIFCKRRMISRRRATTWPASVRPLQR